MKKILFFICLLLFSKNIFSQGVPEIVPPAPNAAALAKYADIPVSKYSGVPNISIPIYTISTGGFQLPISLSYHASGIQVSQEASSVGLGWALNAGGVITRQVRGIEDFSYETGFLKAPPLLNYGDLTGYDFMTRQGKCVRTANPDWGLFKFIHVYCNEVCDKPEGCTEEEDSSYFTFNQLNDTESDLYSFNFGSYSGKFVVNKDGSTTLLSKNSGLKIKVIDSNNWQVIANDGIIYKFTNKEYTIPYSYSKEGYSDNLKYIHGGIAGPRYISSWYLSEILLPNGEIIDFSYARASSESFNYGPIFKSNIHIIEQYNTSNTTNSMIEQFNKTYSKSSSKNDGESYVKTIRWNGGFVNFEYSDRVDIHTISGNAKKLDKITILDNRATEINTINLNYSYFNKQDINEIYNFHSLRLKLDSLSIDDKNYAFNYRNSNELPKKYSNSTDHWGFYNAEPNLSTETAGAEFVPYFMPELNFIGTSYLTQHFPEQIMLFKGANRECNPLVMMNGILESIEYPTKGLVQFNYEPNIFDTELGDHNPSLTKYEDRYTPVEYNTIDHAHVTDSCIGCYVDSPNVTFTLDATTKVDFTVQYFPGGQNHSAPSNELTFGVLTRIDGGGTFNHTWRYIAGDNAHSHEESIELQAGTYMFGTFANTYSSGSGKVNYDIDNGLTPRKEVQGGGARIKSIVSDASTRNFTYYKADDATRTSGILMTPLINYLFELVPNAISITTESSSRYPLSEAISGTVVGYSNVQESISDGIDSSIVKSFFINNPNIRNAGPRAPLELVYNNGFLLKEQYFSNSRMVSEIINEYTKKITDDVYFLRIGIPLRTILKVGYYRIKPEWWKLAKKTNFNYYYDELGNKTETSKVTTYEYNSSNYQVNEITTNDSQDREIKQKITYPTDYTSYIYSEMQSKNIIDKPIETITLLDGKVTDAELTTYAPTQLLDFDSGRSSIAYFPKYLYSLNIKNNANEATFQNYDGTTVSPTYYKKSLNFDRYNLDGNLTQYSTDENKSDSFLWGYNGQYPVAKIENSDFSNVYPLIDNQSILDNPTDDNSLRIELQKIRTGLPDAMVTTYTYDPLIGVTSITDPKGYTVYYEYDEFNRLKFVKDQDGNLLSENKYHYKD